MLQRPGGVPARAEQLGIPRAARPAPAGRAGWAATARLAIRQRIRAPLRLAVPPSRTSQHGHARPLGRDRQPPRRGEIERRRVAPQFADDRAQPRASQPLLHRPQRGARIARLDMDEVAGIAGPADGSARFQGSPCVPAPTARGGADRPGPAGTPPSRRRAGARRRFRTGSGARRGHRPALARPG